MTTPTPRKGADDAHWLMSDVQTILLIPATTSQIPKDTRLHLYEIGMGMKQLISDLAARDAELAAMKQGKALADGMANMIRGFILKTVERETLDESAAKYRKWEEDYCHSDFTKLNRDEWKRKAEEAARDAGKWQSIESAPKTGRTLLLGYVNELGNWRTMRGQWMDENYIAEYWEDPADDAVPGWYETSVNADDVPSCWMIDPTHWMPLPAPPSDAAIAAKGEA